MVMMLSMVSVLAAVASVAPPLRINSLLPSWASLLILSVPAATSITPSIEAELPVLLNVNVPLPSLVSLPSPDNCPPTVRPPLWVSTSWLPSLILMLWPVRRTPLASLASIVKDSLISRSPAKVMVCPASAELKAIVCEPEVSAAAIATASLKLMPSEASITAVSLALVT